MLPRQMFLKPKAETHTNWLQHQEAAQVCEVEHQRGWARWRSTEPLPTEQKKLNQKTSDDTTNVHLSHRRSFNLPSCACESTTSTRTGQARNTRRREPNWKNDLGSDRESDLSWTMISNLPSKLQALGNTSLHDFVTLCANHLPQSSKSKEVSSCPRLCENGKLPAASQVLGCKFGRVHHSGTSRAQNRAKICKDLQRVLGAKSPKQPIGSQDGCRSKSEAISLDAQANAETERGLGDHIFFSRSGSGFHFLSLQVTWNLTSKLIPPLNLKVLQVPWSNLYKFTTGGSAGKKSMTYKLLHPLMGLVKDGVQYDSTK